MQGKYILFALVVILLVCSPVAAITNKIVAGTPVFIGESNLNIASAIGDCHAIAWWPDENDMSGPPAKNLTIKLVNEIILPANRFNISPDVFTGYTGNWYCEDKKPRYVVLTVLEPNLSIRVWDVDNGKDISGQSVPASTNLTYRIDTNLHQAMGYNNRTDLTPADGIFTVRMENPSGKQMNNIYTGNVGATTTKILIFDSNPFIQTPSYIGRNLDSWNRLSRDASGTLLYPAGTYTFTVTQNLNQMQEQYASAGVKDINGKTTSTVSVTILPQDVFTQTPAVIVPAENLTTVPETTVQPVQTIKKTALPTEMPVATKTTYSPLPFWIILLAIGCAGLLAVRRHL
jgi:hypothetical protein